MNRIYSKVWNQSTGQVIVASELKQVGTAWRISVDLDF